MNNVENLIELARKMGPIRLAVIGASALAVLVGLVFFTSKVTSEPHGILFTDLSLQDSNEIVTELESAGIDYNLKNEGATITIPESDINRFRMSLAAKGLPNESVVGYEVFDNQSTLGSTSFVQELNKTRALEGELARTIKALDQVGDARVHLVMPKRELFQRDENPPSASIALKLKRAMNKSQVEAVQHLVASAVKDLKPSAVSIIDDKGNMLASGNSGDESALMTAALDERRSALESRLRNQIEQLVSTHVGLGGARVSVNAELNMTRTTQVKDVFDPDGRVIRSTQSVGEANNSRQPNDNQGVSVGNEIPGAPDSTNSMAVDNSERNEEIVNYEISKETMTVVKEAGELERITVAVLVDNIVSTDADGNVVSTPRSAEELQKIENIVKAAMGFDAQRGDSLTVQNMPFAPLPFNEDEMQEKPFDYMRLIEIAALAIVGLLAAFFVLRPIMKRQLNDDEKQLALRDASGKVVGITDTEGENLVDPLADATEAQQMMNQLLGSTDILAEISEASASQIAELVDNNKREAADIIRVWLHEKPKEHEQETNEAQGDDAVKMSPMAKAS